MGEKLFGDGTQGDQYTADDLVLGRRGTVEIPGENRDAYSSLQRKSPDVPETRYRLARMLALALARLEAVAVLKDLTRYRDRALERLRRRLLRRHLSRTRFWAPIYVRHL